MRTLICTLAVLTAFTIPVKAQDTYVEGYYRQDGTYVQPHYRSAPNSNPYDNYSAQGNINPYTGSIGDNSSPSLNNGGAENAFKPQSYQRQWNNNRPYGSSYRKPQSGM